MQGSEKSKFCQLTLTFNGGVAASLPMNFVKQALLVLLQLQLFLFTELMHLASFCSRVLVQNVALPIPSLFHEAGCIALLHVLYSKQSGLQTSSGLAISA